MSATSQVEQDQMTKWEPPEDAELSYRTFPFVWLALSAVIVVTGWANWQVFSVGCLILSGLSQLRLDHRRTQLMLAHLAIAQGVEVVTRTKESVDA